MGRRRNASKYPCAREGSFDILAMSVWSMHNQDPASLATDPVLRVRINAKLEGVNAVLSLDRSMIFLDNTAEPAIVLGNNLDIVFRFQLYLL